MAFTYTAGSTSDANLIRLLIGDTDSSAPENQRLEDAEITAIVTISGGYRASAAVAADALAAKFARLATGKRLGSAALEWQRYQQLTDLAARLRATSALTAVPFAGGISVAVRDAQRTDTDRVQPGFERGMLDHPDASSFGSTSTT